MKQVNREQGGQEHTADLLCAECESSFKAVTTGGGTTKTGSSVCPECIKQYYVTCAGCELLIPGDESRTRDKSVLCADCHAKPQSGSAGLILLENPDALISEYIALHAEEKRIKARMDELKESLKEMAAVQQRISNAVTLRAGDGAVKCSFRSSLKCNREVVESLAERLDDREFEALFERKMSYSPHRESIQEFLNSTEDEKTEIRELLRSAVIETETATLTVVSNRKE